MSDITELKFPEYLYGINLYNGDDLKGGACWAVSVQEGNIMWQLGRVIDVVFSDYVTIFDPDGLEKFTGPIVKFLNGYYLELGLKVTSISGGARGRANCYMYDNEGNFVSQTGGLVFLAGSTVDAFVGYTLKLALVTQYYPSYGQIGVASPTDVRLTCITIQEVPRGYNSPIISDGLMVSAGQIQSDARAAMGVNVGCQIYQYDMWHITSLEDFATWLHSVGEPVTDPVEMPEEPAGGDDTSGTGGGGGDYGGGGGTSLNPWVNNNDPIDFPDLPTGGALASGAIVGYKVPQATLTSLMQKLWSTSIFDIATWQKLVSNPMDCIISLHCLPFEPDGSAVGEIGIGSFMTGLQAPKISSEYKYIDCGSLNLKHFWGSALDYSPYTRCELYLPFIGIKDIATEDVQGQTVHIKYGIDVLTGDCIAHVKCGQSVMYKFKGNMRMVIPLSSKTTDMWVKTGAAVAGIAGTVATGGSGAVVAGAVAGGAGTVASSKIRTERSGDISGAVGSLDDFRPYFIIHRPAQSLARHYNKYKGYPSNITSMLGSLSGYTEVEHIHLTGIEGATDTELNEIEQLLKNGVII